VIRNLKLDRETFQVAYVGVSSTQPVELILSSMREEVKRVAPNAYLAPPRFSPAVAAARMARDI